MIRFYACLHKTIDCRNFIAVSFQPEARRNRRNLETNRTRHRSSNHTLPPSTVEIAVSVFRVPGIHHREVKSDKEGDPSGEFSRFFLDPRRFRRAHCVTGPHFSARDDYPSVQFMSANDCNLRLIQRCEMVPLALPLARLVARPAEFRLACNKSAKQPKETSGS